METAPFIPRPRNGLTTLIIVALILSGLFLYLNPQEQKTVEIPLSTFVEAVKLGDVTAVKVKDNRLNIIHIPLKSPDRRLMIFWKEFRRTLSVK
ncbi:ATP-dependent metallopeptidase FtsH/Yme1/Tma family protein [Candidatus Peregrinibacteria bacterium]|nr:ATP-dependent metallopeptidase FtsH/Yme1/Tma family protein [Candidatus Peregrinibacteria bacterium]